MDVRHWTEHRDTLEQIERRYRVEAEVVAAVWGLESAYGARRGSTDIISAMATLAYDGRRRDFFEAQLIAALQILQSGDVAPREMVGSWAGAMGHTQFMPTSYLEHAQDFNGDGRRDIWSDDPTDALASTAAYLRNFGWTYGQPWGVEVRLPRGFDYALTGERTRRGAGFWRRQGVTLADGGRCPTMATRRSCLPGGSEGVALMIFDNFRVIERYNPADAYVIGVGHLSDRIAGGPAFRAGWPRGDRALSGDERRELQRRLTAAGFSTGGVSTGSSDPTRRRPCAGSSGRSAWCRTATPRSGCWSVCADRDRRARSCPGAPPPHTIRHGRASRCSRPGPSAASIREQGAQGPVILQHHSTDPHKAPAQRGKVDARDTRLRRSTSGVDPVQPGERGDHRQMLCLDQRHGALARTPVIAVQPVPVTSAWSTTSMGASRAGRSPIQSRRPSRAWRAVRVAMLSMTRPIARGRLDSQTPQALDWNKV
jgi:lytic murein transglycosylase